MRELNLSVLFFRTLCGSSALFFSCFIFNFFRIKYFKNSVPAFFLFSCFLACGLILLTNFIQSSASHIRNIEIPTLFYGIGSGCLVCAVSFSYFFFTKDLHNTLFNPQILLQLLIIALGVGLYEEVFFRYCVQKFCSKLIGKYLGGFIQIVLFALVHHPWTVDAPFLRFFSLMSFALLCTVLAQSRLGLLASIGYHAGYDCASFYFLGVAPYFRSMTNWEQLFGIFDESINMREQNFAMAMVMLIQLTLSVSIGWRSKGSEIRIPLDCQRTDAISAVSLGIINEE